MSTRPPLQFKIATEDWEFELVHQLNYKTFVEEIPQHQPSATPRLVDKFHAENTYLICLNGKELAGMMAVRGKRPFSLDQKLPDLDTHLPPGRRPCELRLLAVEKDYRTGQVFRGLTSLLWQYASDHGFDMAVISGTTRQQKLYRHIGFVPFGPLVGKGEAMFQPMYITLDMFERRAEDFFRVPTVTEGPANFLPGPVAISRAVRKAFEQMPESHRADDFVGAFQTVRQHLGRMVSARHVEIMPGSGTMANDVIAAQLSLEKKPGLVLSNGEFGERLEDHARRFGLTFDTLKFDWGEPFDALALQQLLARSPSIGWIWCTHCETSTGVLNPLPVLKQLCLKAKVKLCVDCISSIGLLPVNLEGVYLASGASGKGLGAYPGLSIVFYNHTVTPSAKLPRYLDLGWYAKHHGIAFTISTNLVRALDAGVQRPDWPRKYSDLIEVSASLRSDLRGFGFTLVAPDSDAAPGVVTIALSKEHDSGKIGEALQKGGFLISYNSGYLRQRNWLQICLMGEYSRVKLTALVTLLGKTCGVGQAARMP